MSTSPTVTRPRIIVPGETVMATRRCAGRRFLLRPDPATCHIIKYCIAVAASRHDVLLHEFVVMSNHYHIVLTDPFGQRPDFFRDANAWIARAINAEFDDTENLFATGSYNAVTLLETDDVIDKMAYTLLNPTAAGLVKLPEYWEGVTSWSMAYGRVEKIQRPAFFGDDMPKEAELSIVRPAGMFPSCDDALARASLKRRVRKMAHALAESSRRRGRGFTGMRRVRRTPRHSCPRTPAPRRRLRPTIASKNTALRTAALRYKRWFLGRYRRMRVAWEGGDREVVFPRGTYLMRVRFGVCVQN